LASTLPVGSASVNGDLCCCHGTENVVRCSKCPSWVAATTTTTVNGDLYEDPAVVYEKLVKSEEVSLFLMDEKVNVETEF